MSTTDNLVFLGVPNVLLNSTTLTATSSTESSGTASTNASFPDPKRIWRSTQDAASLEWDSGTTDTTFGGLYFTGHDLTTNATFTVLLDNTTAFSTTDLVTSTAISVWGASTGNIFGNHTPIWLSSAGNVTRRHFRLDVDDTGHNDMEIGFVGVGPAIQLGRGIGFGLSFTAEDLSSVVETPNGSVFSDERPKRRKWEITHGFLTEDDAFSNVVNQVYQHMGMTRGFCVVPFPSHTSHQESMNFYCRISKMGSLGGEAIPVVRGPRYSVALVFKEIL